MLVVASLPLLAGCGPFGEKPAATLDGHSIPMADFNARVTLYEYLNKKQQAGANIPAALQVPAGKARQQVADLAVTELVDEQLINDDVQRRHIPVTEDEVSADVAAARSLFPSQADFDKALRDYGYTPDQLRQQVRARVTEVKLENAMAAERAAAALTLVKGGTEFAKVVAALSDYAAGGPAGEVTLTGQQLTSLDAQVKPELDKLTPGEVSTTVVRGANGFYIFKLLARDAGSVKFDMVYVYGPGPSRYRRTQRPGWFSKHIGDLEAKAHIHYNVGSRAG
jgi:hypothetical protein